MVICDTHDGIGVRMFDSVSVDTSEAAAVVRIHSVLLPLTTHRMSCSLFAVVHC